VRKEKGQLRHRIIAQSPHEDCLTRNVAQGFTRTVRGRLSPASFSQANRGICDRGARAAVREEQGQLRHGIIGHSPHEYCLTRTVEQGFARTVWGQFSPASLSQMSLVTLQHSQAVREVIRITGR
jgi:hypothetical protein